MNMHVSKVDKHRVIELLKNRLLNGWILVLGVPKCIIALEDAVYTPGTPANRDFEMILARTKNGDVVPLFIARKTVKLRELLKLPDEEWDTLLALVFAGMIGDRCEAEVLGPKMREHIPKAVESIVNQISDLLIQR